MSPPSSTSGGGRQVERAGRGTRAATVAPANQDAKQEAELVAQLEGLAKGLCEDAAELLAVATSREADAKRLAAEEAARAKQAADKARATVGNRVAQQVIEQRSRATSAAAEIAPGPAAAEWQDQSWLQTAAALSSPAGVRVGQLCLPAGNGINEAVKLPLLVPLLNSGNLVVTSDDNSVAAAQELISSTIVRLLAATTPGDLQIQWYDPRLRGTLAPFVSGLREAPLLVAPALTQDTEIYETATELVRTVSQLAELLSGEHNNLGDLQRAAGQSIEPYRLLVVMDFPAEIDERSFDTIVRLAERGPTRGVSLVVHHNSSVASPRDRDPTKLHEFATVVPAGKQGWRSPIAPNLDVSLDSVAPAELVAGVCERVAAAAKVAAAPAIAFRSLLPDTPGEAAESAAERIEVVIGRTGVRNAGFTLGDKIDNTHNVLIAGAAGSGKSNLLHVMIHGVAARYGPDEVEMYLLDLKEGLEFNAFAPERDDGHGLAHARVVGVESDRPFGLAVLQHIHAEFNRRATAFKRVGAQNLAQFREADPSSRMPRLLVVIDEFQALLEGDDNVTDQAVAMFDTLARKGRAYGIHLVLATQTLDGIQSLVTKQDSIFGQFPIRIALKINANGSQVVLQTGNTEAARLRYSGEAILNRNFGDLDSNQRITVAFADKADMAKLRAELCERYPEQPPPLVFVGSEPAELLANPGYAALRNKPTPGTVLIGLPVAVKREPVRFSFRQESGRHLAIIGPGGGSQDDQPESSDTSDQRDVAGHEAIGLLHATALCLGTDRAREQRFLLLDLLMDEQQPVAALAQLATSLSAWGHDVDIISPRALPTAISALRQTLQERLEGASGPTTYVLGFGMHRAAGLDRPAAIGADSPVEELRALVRDGSTFGIHLACWWGNYKSYEQHIESDYSLTGLLQGFCFSGASRDDVVHITNDPFADWQPEANRALLFDRAASQAGNVIVPFAPVHPNQLDQLARGRL